MTNTKDFLHLPHLSRRTVLGGAAAMVAGAGLRTPAPLALAQPPAADAAAQPDCDGGQACNHACHVHASSAAAIAALPTPVAFERGPALFPGNDFLRSATLSHQPSRPPIR